MIDVDETVQWMNADCLTNGSKGETADFTEKHFIVLNTGFTSAICML